MWILRRLGSIHTLRCFASRRAKHNCTHISSLGFGYLGRCDNIGKIAENKSKICIHTKNPNRNGIEIERMLEQKQKHTTSIEFVENVRNDWLNNANTHATPFGGGNRNSHNIVIYPANLMHTHSDIPWCERELAIRNSDDFFFFLATKTKQGRHIANFDGKSVWDSKIKYL